MVGMTISSELGAFLKARRSQLAPRDVGLPEPDSARKVAGLRREEVAQLAAISVDYYTRLEQGRVQASAAVLDTLARALRLDDDQQTYLYEVAGKIDPHPRRRRRPQRMRPAMGRLLDQLTATPAIVLGKRLDVLAWNPAAVALYLDFAQIPPGQRNYLRLLFTDPTIRGLHRQWQHDARDAVAALRMEAAADPDDPELARLVGELSVQDADFRTWWAEHRVTGSGYGTKHYHHQLVGDLTLDCDTWASPDGSGQRLMVLTAEPGCPSHDALRILAAWTTKPEPVRGDLRRNRTTAAHDHVTSSRSRGCPVISVIISKSSSTCSTVRSADSATAATSKSGTDGARWCPRCARMPCTSRALFSASGVACSRGISESGGRVTDVVQSAPERAEYPISSTVAKAIRTKPRSIRSAHSSASVAIARRA
jgi:transcriptional regulator with XRE-family HTH domain